MGTVSDIAKFVSVYDALYAPILLYALQPVGGNRITLVFNREVAVDASNVKESFTLFKDEECTDAYSDALLNIAVDEQQETHLHLLVDVTDGCTPHTVRFSGNTGDSLVLEDKEKKLPVLAFEQTILRYD